MNPRLAAQYSAPKDFDVGDQLTKEKGGAFTHQVHKVTHNESKETYYQKYCDNHFAASVEATAGQLFNLVMPYQPKTLIGKGADDKQYIYSQEVAGYQGVHDRCKTGEQYSDFKQQLHDGRIQGMGRMMVMDYFLQEVDAKLGNMGIAKIKGVDTLIKIDNDWCLSALQNNKFGYSNDPNVASAKITEAGISLLPLRDQQAVHNWMDCVQEGKVNLAYNSKARFRLLEDSLPNAPHMRKEINETLLKVLLLPQALMRDIASRNCGKDSHYDDIAKELDNRQGQMRDAALQNASFRQYLKTGEAKQCLQEIQTNITQFQTHTPLSSLDVTSQPPQQLQLLTLASQVADLQTTYAKGGVDLRESYKNLTQMKTKIEEAVTIAGTINDDKQKQKFINLGVDVQHEMKAVEVQNVVQKKSELFDKAYDLVNSDEGGRLSKTNYLKYAEYLGTKAEELRDLTGGGKAVATHSSAEYGNLATHFKGEVDRIKTDLSEESQAQQSNEIKPNR